MKIKTYIFLIIIFISNLSQSQINNFDRLEQYVISIPKTETSDIASVGKYLRRGAKTKKEIIARIYFWLAENIEYDWDAFLNKRQIDVSAIYTFENKKSVCAGFANLFKSICDNANIKCVIIKGYAKGYGYVGERLSEPNHDWNAVKLYDKWELIDPTWGGGFLLNDRKIWCARYLFDDPNDFILEHLPEDEEWQLLENKITIDTFFSAEMEKKRKIRNGEIEE